MEGAGAVGDKADLQSNDHSECHWCAFPTEHSFSWELRYAGACLPLLCVVLPWSQPGEAEAPVFDCSTTADPVCPLSPSSPSSAFAPLCVFNGDKCEAHGVQSHCGLKRISDDRKYVNLLFPSGQRKTYRGSMDEEDNTRALYHVFPTKDFKVIFV